MKLNAKLETFPTVLVAGMFGFRAEPYFEAEAEAARGPEGRILVSAAGDKLDWNWR